MKVDKLKKIVQCPDCGLSMTQHTLLYIHKRRVLQSRKTLEKHQNHNHTKPKITGDVVNDSIKQNPDIVSHHLRNERALKAPGKQMNARPLSNNAF